MPFSLVEDITCRLFLCRIERRLSINCCIKRDGNHSKPLSTNPSLSPNTRALLADSILKFYTLTFVEDSLFPGLTSPSPPGSPLHASLIAAPQQLNGSGSLSQRAIRIDNCAIHSLRAIAEAKMDKRKINGSGAVGEDLDERAAKRRKAGGVSQFLIQSLESAIEGPVFGIILLFVGDEHRELEVRCRRDTAPHLDTHHSPIPQG